MNGLLYFFAAGALLMCAGESLFARTGFDALGALLLLGISCMFFCAGAIVGAVKNRTAEEAAKVVPDYVHEIQEAIGDRRIQVVAEKA